MIFFQLDLHWGLFGSRHFRWKGKVRGLWFRAETGSWGAAPGTGDPVPSGRHGRFTVACPFLNFLIASTQSTRFLFCHILEIFLQNLYSGCALRLQCGLGKRPPHDRSACSLSCQQKEDKSPMFTWVVVEPSIQFTPGWRTIWVYNHCDHIQGFQVTTSGLENIAFLQTLRVMCCLELLRLLVRTCSVRVNIQ